MSQTAILKLSRNRLTSGIRCVPEFVVIRAELAFSSVLIGTVKVKALQTAHRTLLTSGHDYCEPITWLYLCLTAWMIGTAMKPAPASTASRDSHPPRKVSMSATLGSAGS